MSGFDAARRAYSVLDAMDKADPDGASGQKGGIQTAMAILLTMIPEDVDHRIVCDGDRCVGCALDAVRRAAGVVVGAYDASGSPIDAG
jgi:hypothetical protein